MAFLISNMTIGLDPYRNHMRDHLLAIEIGRKNMTHCLFLIKKSFKIPTFFLRFQYVNFGKKGVEY